MFVFAISDAVWLAIIGVLAMAVKEYFDQRRARYKDIKDAEVAKKVEEVAQKAEVAAGKVEEVAVQAKVVVSKVEEVKITLDTTTVQHGKKLDDYHREVNSMKDQLVEEVRKSSFALGEKSEKEKQA